MIEAKKCVRCGSLYISNSEVCSNCQTKDGADIYKLKGFMETTENENITQGELSILTGISNKNLSRFLGYDEFKGICVDKEVV